MTQTMDELLTRALDAYDTLTALGEDVEDEWTYVNDLSSAWRERIQAVSEARGAEVTEAAAADALDRLIAEVEAIRDPHRAIDWLSTYPQVVLLAVGERP